MKLLKQCNFDRTLTNFRLHILHLTAVFKVHRPHVSIKIARRIRRCVHPPTVNQKHNIEMEI